MNIYLVKTLMSKSHAARQASSVYILNATLKRCQTRENRLPGSRNTMSLSVRGWSISYAYRTII